MFIVVLICTCVCAVTAPSGNRGGVIVSRVSPISVTAFTTTRADKRVSVTELVICAWDSRPNGCSVRVVAGNREHLSAGAPRVSPQGCTACVEPGNDGHDGALVVGERQDGRAPSPQVAQWHEAMLDRAFAYRLAKVEIEVSSVVQGKGAREAQLWRARRSIIVASTA